MFKAYKRYEIVKKFRWKAYSGMDPRVAQRISQNWGPGNIIYKFLDREGYNGVFELIKAAVGSNFKIVDDAFLQNLKQKLSTVVVSEIGYDI